MVDTFTVIVSFVIVGFVTMHRLYSGDGCSLIRERYIDIRVRQKIEGEE